MDDFSYSTLAPSLQSSRLPITLRRSLIFPMIGFSERSLLANLKKNWARRPIRKEQIVANQHPTWPSRVNVRLLLQNICGDCQGRAKLTYVYCFTTSRSNRQGRAKSRRVYDSMVVAPSLAKAVTAETEQSTSSAAQYLATTSD